MTCVCPVLVGHLACSDAGLSIHCLLLIQVTVTCVCPVLVGHLTCSDAGLSLSTSVAGRGDLCMSSFSGSFGLF